MDTTVLELGLTNLRRSASPADTNVDLLERLPTIADRVSDLAGECSVMMQAMMGRNPPGCSQIDLIDELVGREITIRTVWSHTEPYMPSHVPADGGYDVRRLGELPVDRLFLFDHEAAVVSVPGVPVSDAALYVRGRKAVEPYVKVFERGRAAARSTDTPGLIPEHRRVLRLLARGYRDVEVAEELCVTDRTVRRYLRDLHSISRTRTRFQLGAWARTFGYDREGPIHPSSDERSRRR